MKPLIALLSPLFAAWPAVNPTDSIDTGLIAAMVPDRARPSEDRQTDRLRKPEDMLALAGVRRGMMVGEFYPQGGYFTRLLVGSPGHVYAIGSGRLEGSINVHKAMLVQGKGTNVSIISEPLGMVRFPKPIDLVWLARNYHDLKTSPEGKIDTVGFQGRPGKAGLRHVKPRHTDRYGLRFVKMHQSWRSTLERILLTMPVLVPARN